MGRNLIARVSKTCDNRQADSGKIKPGSETVKNPDPDSFRPQNQRSRTQNPQQTRAQPPVERGWADKADSRPPLRGPGQYCSARNLHSILNLFWFLDLRKGTGETHIARSLHIRESL